MAVRWCSYRFIMLVVFACYADAQPNWWFPPTNNPQPQVKPKQPQWPEPQWPQQQTPQKPQQRTPQRPESQGPQLQTPQRPHQQTPQWPQPQGPHQQTPQRPEPQRPQQQTPQRPESKGPQQQTPQRPEPQWPQPHGPQLQTPQWPQLQNPQRPEPHGPQLQTPQRPEPQRPQPQTPQRPEPHGPQLQTPQWPQLQTPQCQVESKDTVQCGTPKITLVQCEAIDCCFNGQQCYYGKAVTVQCTMDAQFVVVVARNATWPKIDIDTIILLGGNNGPCSPVGITSAFAIYQFPVTACGTTLKEENGYMVYENRMVSSYEVGVVPQGAITRDSQFELLFQCKYSNTAVKALVIEVNSVPAPAPVAVMGPLRLELRLAKGICDTKTCKDESSAFTSFYTEEDYPLTKVLRQPVYVEVRILEKKDPNLVLLLERCWTTSDPSLVSMPQWDLLIEKCSYHNDKYQTTMVPVELSSGLLYPSHYKRFILKMFTFVDHTLAPRKDTIFIHCSASLCYPTPWDSCEPKCNKQRRDVAWRKTRQTAVVSSGEVVLVDKKPA
ncbi:zona pellucida sperm-binding protein 4-like [Oncorhynchus tshawytscha]|uniref:zona pellucida sperm-binding protein 4-like n=1 Tax=Oncorhynchus tshawytscha TaxID=74940 RepID=UPI001C3E4C74|nr:zona pellucida sperm-binding protein 4-like [Oncorhynchus tshawytscha]